MLSAYKVSLDALLIPPKNVGLTPRLSVKNVANRIVRFKRLMERVPRTEDVGCI